MSLTIKFIDILQDSLKQHCNECDQDFEGKYCEYCREENLKYFGGDSAALKR